MVVFRSISLPVILVAVIEGAIFVNMGIPFYTGTAIPFIISILEYNPTPKVAAKNVRALTTIDFALVWQAMSTAWQAGATHSSRSGKEETVYILADAKGDVNKVIVSNWIKNGEGSSSLADVSYLQDIENVKGYEGYTAGSILEKVSEGSAIPEIIAKGT